MKKKHNLNPLTTVVNSAFGVYEGGRVMRGDPGSLTVGLTASYAELVRSRELLSTVNGIFKHHDISGTTDF